MLDKITQKEQQIGKLNGKIKSLQEEIDRRQFIEKKVQTYVKTLCGQNEKLKEIIRQEVSDTNRAK